MKEEIKKKTKVSFEKGQKGVGKVFDAISRRHISIWCGRFLIQGRKKGWGDKKREKSVLGTRGGVKGRALKRVWLLLLSWVKWRT